MIRLVFLLCLAGLLAVLTAPVSLAASGNRSGLSGPDIVLVYDYGRNQLFHITPANTSTENYWALLSQSGAVPSNAQATPMPDHILIHGAARVRFYAADINLTTGKAEVQAVDVAPAETLPDLLTKYFGFGQPKAAEGGGASH